MGSSGKRRVHGEFLSKQNKKCFALNVYSLIYLMKND